ncbi:MAG: hypothetical protein KC483_00035 [Nitrosarchaeum sp.]|nr:hypothetical protein [Nitrosarchaeum sp.]
MCSIDVLSKEFLLEELLLQREFYLNTFKHLELKNIDENSKETRQMMKINLGNLKSIEDEIGKLLNY